MTLRIKLRWVDLTFLHKSLVDLQQNSSSRWSTRLLGFHYYHFQYAIRPECGEEKSILHRSWQIERDRKFSRRAQLLYSHPIFTWRWVGKKTASWHNPMYVHPPITLNLTFEVTYRNKHYSLGKLITLLFNKDIPDLIAFLQQMQIQVYNRV